MARIEHEVTINRPAAEVFEYMTRLEELPRWQESCHEVQLQGQGPVGVGTQWTEKRTVMGRESEVEMEVVEYEPNRRFAVRSRSGPVGLSIEHDLEPAGDGTRVRVVGEAQLGRLSKLAGPMVKRQARQMFETDFARLKQELESP